MEVVVVIEFEAGKAATNAALLQRIGALTLKGQAKLSFVGTDAAAGGGPARDVVALGLPSEAAAGRLLAQWRGEGVINADAPARILRLQSLWSMEPLALMFP